LPALDSRTLETIEGILCQDAVVTDPLDFQELPIDLVPEFTQIRKLGNRLRHVKVLRIVDSRFGPERVLLLEVLLYVRRLVLDMQAGLDPIGNHARPVAKGGWWRGAGQAQRKQQADAVRASEIEILANHGLEEVTALDGPIEDVGEADFELTDREAVVVAGGAFGRGHGPRQPM
jgi:hypothetical protein